MSEGVVLTDVDGRGVAWVTLNRPEVHNAYNRALLDALTAGLDGLAARGDVRVLVIKSDGKHFQAGADIAYLREAAGFTFEQNLEFSRVTTRAMQRLNEFPGLTIALVNGACYGGGVGLVACCDAAICADDAVFGLTEVRIGVVPSPIAYYLNASMGVHNVRRYGLTAERFGPEQALRMGLVQEVVTRAGLREAADRVIGETLANGPDAVRLTKRLALEKAGLLLSDEQVEELAQLGARQRASDEGREGLNARLEKRKPRWAPQD